ncbi:hypothetical protein QCA50_000622 [Cerrena zonata]|uniref:Secreted protein n=1 Tax=Cerrena zonata TaxID=2478898 RepID=A0AAW0GZC7_9APHY
MDYIFTVSPFLFSICLFVVEAHVISHFTSTNYPIDLPRVTAPRTPSIAVLCTCYQCFSPPSTTPHIFYLPFMERNFRSPQCIVYSMIMIWMDVNVPYAKKCDE